jgi:hypothetical protein
MNIRSIITLATFTLLANPANAGTADDFKHLIKSIVADFGLKPSEVESFLKLDKDRKITEGMLSQHADRFLDDPGKVEAIQSFLLSRRYVTADGDMAAVSYYDWMKSSLSGDWRLITGQYKEWHKAYPSSALPVILTASSMLSAYAPQLRVALVKSTAIEPNIVDMKGLEATKTFLLANKERGSKDPYWYNLMIETQLLLGDKETGIKAIVEEGITRFPDNVQLPILASSFYLSKWQGDVTKLKDYTAWVLSIPAAQNRFDIAPRIYSHALETQYGITLFKLAPKDWPVLRKGIELLMSSYPSKENRTRSTILTCLAGDKALTRSIMSVEPDGSDFNLWPDKDAQTICRSWALSS